MYICIIPFQYRRESSRLYWDGHCTYNRVGTVQPNNGTTMYNIECSDDRYTKIRENTHHQMLKVPEDIPGKLPFPPGAAHCCPL